MVNAVQTNYSINPDRGFPGLLAQPSAPHALDSGVLHVPGTATRKPQPGDAVYYDATEDAYAVPTTAAHSLAVCGILSYRQDTVADADSKVKFDDGDEVEVAVLGGFWVTAGSAVEYNQLLAWDRADYLWDTLTKPAAFADLVTNPIVCVSRHGVAANGLAIARIGYGRAT